MKMRVQRISASWLKIHNFNTSMILTSIPYVENDVENAI
jgi:hypothetical protein